MSGSAPTFQGDRPDPRLADLASHPGIEVNRNRHSGTPVIRGTRIDADAIGALAASRPDDAAEICDDYDVTPDELVAAVKWWEARP